MSKGEEREAGAVEGGEEEVGGGKKEREDEKEEDKEEDKEEAKEEEGEEGSDDEEEDSDEEEEEEEVGIALQLPQRATRGLAYQRLIGEALEEDQAFWSHNTWADEEEDADYNCSEGEEVYADVIDSDFDRPEDDEEEGDSSSDGDGREGEGEGGRRGGQGEKSAGKKRDSRQRREKKRKKRSRGRGSDEEDDETGDRKRSRKQAFELMWKRRQAKREREERQRREEKKTHAKRQQQKEDGKRRLHVKDEEDQREVNRDRAEEGTLHQKQQSKEGLRGVATTRQLRVRRGRCRFRRGDGSSSTSDEQENNGSKSSSSSSQKRKNRQQKKPLERTRAGGAVREVTLEEHLEEARRTEKKNLAVLLAMEERDEARRLRHVFDLKKNMYAGDYDRYFSWASWLVVGDQAAEETEAAPAAEPAAADTTQQHHLQQEPETKQEQQTKTQQQECHNTDTQATTAFCNSNLAMAKGKKAQKAEAEEAAAATGMQRDMGKTGASEAPGAFLRGVKEEPATAADAEGKHLGAAEGAETAESDAAGRDGRSSSSASCAASEGQEAEVPWSEASASGIGEKKEKKEVQGTDDNSAAFPCFLKASSEQASLSKQQEQQQQLQQGHPKQQQSLQQDAQPQQEHQAPEGRLGERCVGLQQKVSRQEAMACMPSGRTPATESAAEERGARSAENEKDEEETQEEARECEGYAMELRMFTDGKFPDMYTQQPATSARSHPRCIITGQRARYRDPLTGAPYATLHAFKCLRETFQQVREQQLLQVMQQIKHPGSRKAAVSHQGRGATYAVAAAAGACVKDVLNTAGRDKCSTTSVPVGGGLVFASPSAACASPAAAAGGGDNGHVYVPSDLALRSSTISSSYGSISDYTTLLGGEAEAVISHQVRQRKAVAGAQTILLKKNKPLTPVNSPQGSGSCSETAACNAVPISVEGWTLCREVEQKRRRNARNASSCGRKAGSSRPVKKM